MHTQRKSPGKLLLPLLAWLWVQALACQSNHELSHSSPELPTLNMVPLDTTFTSFTTPRSPDEATKAPVETYFGPPMLEYEVELMVTVAKFLGTGPAEKLSWEEVHEALQAQIAAKAEAPLAARAFGEQIMASYVLKHHLLPMTPAAPQAEIAYYTDLLLQHQHHGLPLMFHCLYRLRDHWSAAKIKQAAAATLASEAVQQALQPSARSLEKAANWELARQGLQALAAGEK
jgi:hypothetical protein